MSKESCISIVGNNLEFEQVVFISAVVIPSIIEALEDHGIGFDSFKSSIKKPNNLCENECKKCAFRVVCNESEEV